MSHQTAEERKIATAFSSLFDERQDQVQKVILSEETDKIDTLKRMMLQMLWEAQEQQPMSIRTYAK